MKLFKSILLIAACHAAQASAAIDINADPNLTGAAPLTGILNGQQSDTQNMSGFDNTPPPSPPVVMSRMFGAQLFNGTSADSGATVGFNPDYILNPGDSIQVRLWGAFTFDGALQVDPKGNIFLPNVGPVKVAGVSNSQLNALVTSKVKEVYQSNVNVYASLLQAQPVKVYVTGFVRNPGLYGGVTSDSLLNYLIKAGGVDPERGSYVDIVVKRGNRVRSNVNLYDFLLNGKLGLSQFADGDTIIVGPRQHTFSVQGDVFNSYDFEFRESSIPVTEALSWARPKPGATHITIMRKQGLQKRSEYYPISSAPGRMLQNGDTLIVSTDRYAGTIQGTALWFHYACGSGKSPPEQHVADERSSALSPISGSASERDAESLAAKAGGSITFCPVIHQRRSQPANAGSTTDQPLCGESTHRCSER